MNAGILQYDNGRLPGIAWGVQKVRGAAKHAPFHVGTSKKTLEYLMGSGDDESLWLIKRYQPTTRLLVSCLVLTCPPTYCHCR